MSREVFEKLNGFLSWYQDLYGKEWFVRNGDILTAIRNGEIGLSSLQVFKGRIQDCQKCSLGKTRKNFVFGHGNENADIMFIGEAPGHEEDMQGLPFVGKSGQLLNQMLEKISLKREDVFIANILKCRPPNNRDPLPEEVSTCIPYLHKQIEMVQPKVLITLGRVAAHNLLKSQESLTRLRNRSWQYQNIPLIVTFHPAYILRNMSALDDGVNDLKLAIAQYEKVR